MELYEVWIGNQTDAAYQNGVREEVGLEMEGTRDSNFIMLYKFHSKKS